MESLPEHTLTCATTGVTAIISEGDVSKNPIRKSPCTNRQSFSSVNVKSVAAESYTPSRLHYVMDRSDLTKQTLRNMKPLHLFLYGVWFKWMNVDVDML